MILLFIIFLDAFVPLSTDLYLPALPTVASHLQASMGQVNMTLVAFFVPFSLGMLIWGPLSDTFGRRPIIRIGLIGYLIGSLCCASSTGLTHFIIFRSIQGLGGGAASAVAMAMVKDLYTGRQRETVLAVVQSMVIIIPVVAPTLGALLLKVASWRGAFYLLSLFGALGVVGSFCIHETLQEREKEPIWKTFLRPVRVLGDKVFTSLLITFSITAMPMMGFIAASSFVYIKGFGLSEQVYGLFFALNAICAMVGPALYILVSRYVARKRLISCCFILMMISGVLIIWLGGEGPLIFALTVLPTTLAGGMLRPPGTFLMLGQHDGDAGTASSLINCAGLLLGAIGMAIISLPWGNTIIALGGMSLTIGLLSGLGWLFISRKVAE